MSSESTEIAEYLEGNMRSKSAVDDALNSQLENLQLEPPDCLAELEQEVWNRTVVPLIKGGILKETDYYSAIAYCELATYKVTELSPSQASQLAKLRDQLGMTPASRVKVAQAASTQKPLAIADVLELNVG